ncbi:lytic polysaccharide monooxygenase [Lophiostoma macrostomum CBS 122681]|uniref:AA9 family lytic polysaccharide monooxygenase n=1 Tax=Lophiostoma macrostomum CBS 122681 TaxID=1314788 RepID=A0A6A6TCX8_9PLEO|nr:lytic polysaccharide monooxygenase [Lophiostoma macrostomum CBS 122681]
MKFLHEQVSSKASMLALLLLQSVPQVSGHYGFPILSVNGKWSEWWEFVRPVGLDGYGSQFFPSYDWTGSNQVCGINATKTGHLTGTVKVEAGSTLGFVAIAATYSQGVIDPHPYRWGPDGIGHAGPGQVYMSLAPGALEDYEGDGDWFKIATSGASDGQHWDSDGQPWKPSLNATIPKTTPPGKYLVRVEHFNISPSYNGTQQFMSCAHVEVTGSGGGTPGPTIKFPGSYNIEDPRPGPAVWTG